ncbi:DUF4184 family protein [Streptomyces sp. NPDC059256]|uniref:DUF4184 family protein n=1 Tax=Streptomyces sp. NPDC059256 TaxID=3346794 RepID=UPI003695A20E
MPFTLSHPAAVLPLLRRPFVPVALVMGAMAPDVPYFLQTLRISVAAGDWYGPFLNATTSHSLTGVLTVTLPCTLVLVAGYWLLRGPVTGLLPARLVRPAPALPNSAVARAHYGAWLLLSALIGIATHLVWDSFTHFDGYVVDQVAFLREPVAGGLTPARLLQHLSTAIGLTVLGAHLWRRRVDRRTPRSAGSHALTPAIRWSVTAFLGGAALLGAAAHSRGIDAHRQLTIVDTSRPLMTELGDGATSITYPTRTEPAPWHTVAEGMLSDAAKGAGASLAAALVLYAIAWHLHRVLRPSRRAGTEARPATASVPGGSDTEKTMPS